MDPTASDLTELNRKYPFEARIRRRGRRRVEAMSTTNGRRRRFESDVNCINPVKLAMIVIILLIDKWTDPSILEIPAVEAVNVRRLNVPDLVVIDQHNAPIHQTSTSQQHIRSSSVQQPIIRPTTAQQYNNNNNNNFDNQQPVAASLININQQPDQLTFECLVSYDKSKDKNLIVKWHHDDRIEPIYQWIPELNKRSIAPQYRAFIVPITQPSSASNSHQQSLMQLRNNSSSSLEPSNGYNEAHVRGGFTSQHYNASHETSFEPETIQTLEAGFRLVRPSKELGGKYTCSAISSQNDDSKWKKMIVYSPPRSFRFNASRTDISGSLMNSQRLIQATQAISHPGSVPQTGYTSLSSQAQLNQLPPVYRMRANIQQQQQQQQSAPTTISPQMYSTIDYVNVNQQRTRQSASPWLVGPATMAPLNQQTYPSTLGNNNNGNNRLLSQQQQQPIFRNNNSNPMQRNNGVKLVCDIDQVFPVPEVSIYRLAKLDGSHPDKLAKLDTRIERDSMSGLYHVQVTSLLDDDELQMKYGLNEPVYFECLIALTNLELSKYADNKRSLVYQPGGSVASHNTANLLGAQHTSLSYDGTGSSAATTHRLFSWLGAGYLNPFYQHTILIIALSMLSNYYRLMLP